MTYNEFLKIITSVDADQDLWSLLMDTQHTLFRAREMELRRYGISPDQADLLFLVQMMRNTATLTQLSRYLLKELHSTASLVDRMAKRGLVKRSKDLERKNLVRVAITGKGLEAYEQSAKRGPIHRVMAELTSEEKKKFCEYLKKLYHQARQELRIDIDKLPSSEW